MMPTMCPEVSWRGVSRLILGSKSWSRKTLLNQLDPPPYDIIPANIDESSVISSSIPRDKVLAIALAKARALISHTDINVLLRPSSCSFSKYNNYDEETETEADGGDDIDIDINETTEDGKILLICGDALVVHKDKILGKPKSLHEASQLIQSYSQAPVTTVSSIVIVDVEKKRYWANVDEAEVYFRDIPNHIIKNIVEENNNAVLQSAGALRIEQPEIQPYVDCIVGDISAVMGFSQPLLASLMSNIVVDETEGTPL